MWFNPKKNAILDSWLTASGHQGGAPTESHMFTYWKLAVLPNSHRCFCQLWGLA